MKRFRAADQVFERTLEGLKAAAARGRRGGSWCKLSDEDLAMARALLKDASIPVAQVVKRLSVSRATFYGLLLSR